MHEQIGDELFDENMLENVTDLRDRILRPGGKILPARFKLFMEPIELHKEHAVPAVWQREVHGIRFDCLKDRPLGPWRHVDPNAAAHSRWMLTNPADWRVLVSGAGGMGSPQSEWGLMSSAEISGLASLRPSVKAVTFEKRCSGAFASALEIEW